MGVTQGGGQMPHAEKGEKKKAKNDETEGK